MMPGGSSQAGDGGAWLCGIARNHARRRWERDRRTLRCPKVRDGWSGDGRQPDPAELANAEIDALRRAVLSLPVRYREAVVLCDLQGLSYADAALALDCAVGTVRSRLHRGRALLTAKVRAIEPAEF
jgi:RNA polymerase sigma-70 factor (ECF subfamily)